MPLKNYKWEKFSEYYATDTELFGNGVQSYAKAYDIDITERGGYKNAQSAASQLLLRPIILARINYFLESRLGLNDAFADKQLAFVIAQSADLRSKMAAIKEYNALKGRIKKKLELSFEASSDVEIDAELEAIEYDISQAQALLAARKGKPKEPAPGMPTLTEEQEARMNNV
jgi:hypothetical protein